RGVERPFAQTFLGSKTPLFRKVRLEALGLLDMETLEVAELGIGFETVQGFRDAVERRLAEAFGLGQVGEVRALDSLILGVVHFHWPQPSCRSHNSRRGQSSLLCVRGLRECDLQFTSHSIDFREINSAVD